MIKGYFRPQITYLRSYNLIQTAFAPGLQRVNRSKLVFGHTLRVSEMSENESRTI